MHGDIILILFNNMKGQKQTQNRSIFSHQKKQSNRASVQKQKSCSLLFTARLSLHEVLSVAQNSGYIPTISIHHPDFKLHPALEHAFGL